MSADSLVRCEFAMMSVPLEYSALDYAPRASIRRPKARRKSFLRDRAGMKTGSDLEGQKTTTTRRKDVPFLSALRSPFAFGLDQLSVTQRAYAALIS